MQIEVGTVLEGKVTGIAAFGAFVEFPDGKSGLIHISEIASEYVEDIKQFIKVGQQVKVKVIGTEKGKLSLSLKQAGEEVKAAPKRKEKKQAPPQEKGFRQPPVEFEFKKQTDMSFDDMLQKFKKDSEEKNQDLKRNTEGKRSGGYKRAY